VDYDEVMQDFEMPIGVESKDFYISIIDNEIPEPDKVFFLRLSAKYESDSIVLGQKKMCTITIIDDDGRKNIFNYNFQTFLIVLLKFKNRASLNFLNQLM